MKNPIKLINLNTSNPAKLILIGAGIVVAAVGVTAAGITCLRRDKTERYSGTEIINSLNERTAKFQKDISNSIEKGREELFGKEDNEAENPGEVEYQKNQKNFNLFTVKELKEEATTKGISFPSKVTKSELIALLEEGTL